MLPPLTIEGHQIVRAGTGEPVVLRGVNRSGLEYSPPDGHGITPAEMEEIVTGWGSRIVRLPFNQDWVLRRPGYRETLDAVIEWTAARGAYTLLDLQWINTGVKIAPLPDFETPAMWRALAERYRGNPAVLYDLYNEPHDVPAADWRYWATLLTDTIREVHPEALLFVSGIDWGYDLRGVLLDRPRIVYSTHVYPWKTSYLDPGTAFGWLAGQQPLFGGEWGGHDGDLNWGRDIARYMDERGMGWTAWSWSDDPHLVRDGVPTPFGELVRSLLTPSGTS